MRQVPIRRRWFLPILASGAISFLIPCGGSAQPPAAKPTGENRPAWKAIEKTIKSTMAQTKDYESGDILSRDEAENAFDALKKLGWEVESRKKLTKRFLPASDEMVRLLRGKRGTKFMRKISTFPGGYDRLDKLRELPDGRQRMKELITQPGGHTLIEYLATTRGGKNLGKQLSSRTRGNFNEPTNRIYTEAGLVATLKQLYEGETKEKAGVQSPRRRR